MNNKKKFIALAIIALVIVIVLSLLFLKKDNDPIDKPIDDPVIVITNPTNGYLGNDPSKQEHPKAPELTWIKNLDVPEYSGEAYVLINDGLPFFDMEHLTNEPWELYYDLDNLGRCTLAEATVGLETMPTEKRGDISSIHPTGWQSSRYPQELVDGQSLYNRCHLIAFGMCGESANKYNLVTGTRYFNTEGINALENMIMDYIKETGNHVHYRVTPVFTGDNAICDGQVTEAYSIEDKGEGICFCIYSYNVQPGIVIDYGTGENWLANGEKPESNNNKKENYDSEYLLEEDIISTFILNTNKMKIHKPDCEGVKNMSEKNKKEYTGSYNELIKMGYVPDNECKPYGGN